MLSSRAVRQPFHAAIFLIRWLVWMVPLGIVIGAACAVFLISLDFVTGLRMSHPWLVVMLPVAGGAVGGIFATFGRSADAGNNLILDQIHEPGGGVPLRMTPLILGGTLVTHLCGGSAGREGTAVQMGGSLASGVNRCVPGFRQADSSIMLTAGVAAGFSGVFGTPVAGVIFALEVLTIGRMSYAAVLPCLMASFISNQTCLALGAEHTKYLIQAPSALDAVWNPTDLLLLSYCLIAGIAFGLAAQLFTLVLHFMQTQFSRIPGPVWIRPVAGGFLVLVLLMFAGDDYLGLGVSAADPSAVTISSAFRSGGANHSSWIWKSLLTSVTVGSGFRGGEVTPLFFIGATLGNSLSELMGLPADLLAGMGFVAVFAGAANTPLACIIMAVELFGSHWTPCFAVACITAYTFAGPTGIYRSQRPGTPKHVLSPRPPATDSQPTQGSHDGQFFHDRIAAVGSAGVSVETLPDERLSRSQSRLDA